MLGFLQNQIEDHINNIPLAVLRQIYFQQDGAPPQNTSKVPNYLIELVLCLLAHRISLCSIFNLGIYYK